MSELERQFELVRDPCWPLSNRAVEHLNSGTGEKCETAVNCSTVHIARIVADVVCDDRQVQLTVEGHNTVGQIRHLAIAEMQIMTQDAEKYVVIGPNRQPVSDQRTVDEIINEGQELCFRLIPQVAFGPL